MVLTRKSSGTPARAKECLPQTCEEMVNAATQLNDLKVPPGNKLEELEDDREGQHSIRINDQFRVCFVWQDGDAYDVEVTDYH